MSKITKNSVSGTPDAKPTASISPEAMEWALTVALQKTEWHNLKGIATRFLTLTDKKSGKRFAAVFWACPADELTADNDSGTFFVNGVDVDDLVAQINMENKKVKDETI